MSAAANKALVLAFYQQAFNDGSTSWFRPRGTTSSNMRTIRSKLITASSSAG